MIHSPGTHPHSRSSVRLERPAVPAGGGKRSLPTPARWSSPPGTRERECKPRCGFYWPSPLFCYLRHWSSIVFITNVTNDLMSIQIRSDWSMRETIVSRENLKPIARPTVSHSTPHLVQTKSACQCSQIVDPSGPHN